MPDDTRYRVEITRSPRYGWNWHVYSDRVHPDGRILPDPGRWEAVPPAFTYRSARRRAFRYIARHSPVTTGASDIRLAPVDGKN